ncbi:MAG: FG-GAP-like repeat-containing protein [Thermodesulfobacteriota bacterium]|nr:FG-GAP-like repeat-containing protein [Thermodesulfobacteriota bacterium]
MKFKLILILYLFSLLASPSCPSAQPRDPGKVYKVAILPFLIHSQENLDYLREGISDILTSRITVEGRIIVIERTLVERALYEERPMRLDETVATKIGRRVGADYIILGSITKVGAYISLDSRLISVTEEKPPLGVYTQHKGIDDVMVKIGEFAQDIGYRILGHRAMASRPTDPRHPYIIQPRRDIGRIDSEGLGFKKSQTFDFEIKGLDIGDVDGDGKNEVVITDNNNVYIFKYDGEKLTLFQKVEQGYEHNFLTLDVADVNRNGIAEIIVTSVVEDDLRSFILEYEEGKFKKITGKAGWFFRVLDHPKDGPILMGQQMGSDGLFVGSIYKFVWKKKSFERGAKMDFPKETKIFGLALANLRSKETLDILTLDEFDRLRAMSREGKTFWSSRDYFGGTTNFYETKKKVEAPYRAGTAPPWRTYIPTRILIKDFDGDGFHEVIINKNHPSGTRLFHRIRSFDKAEVYSLFWDSGSLTTNWKTREIDGYISDYQVKDIDNDGTEELVVAIVAGDEESSGILSRKWRSNILFFKLF